MKLSALARETGASTASIKYYIHVGILPSGRKRNATTADYSQAHIDRLALIIWLRRKLGTPIDSISALTRTIDDKALETIELMGICQRVALEASNVLISAQPAQSPAPIACPTDHERSSDASVPASDASVPASDVPEPSSIENDIRDVLGELGWPDISPTAVTSLAAVLDELRASGYPVGPDTIRRHIQALAEVAGRNTSPITDDLSREQICLQVIRGITLHNRLLLATSALVHASLSAMPRTSHHNEPQATKFV